MSADPIMPVEHVPPGTGAMADAVDGSVPISGKAGRAVSGMIERIVGVIQSARHAEAVQELRRAGVALWVDSNGLLHARGPRAVLCAAVAAEIAETKPQLVRELQTDTWICFPDPDPFRLFDAAAFLEDCRLAGVQITPMEDGSLLAHGPSSWFTWENRRCVRRGSRLILECLRRNGESCAGAREYGSCGVRPDASNGDSNGTQE